MSTTSLLKTSIREQAFVQSAAWNRFPDAPVDLQLRKAAEGEAGKEPVSRVDVLLESIYAVLATMGSEHEQAALERMMATACIAAAKGKADQIDAVILIPESQRTPVSTNGATIGEAVGESLRIAELQVRITELEQALREKDETYAEYAVTAKKEIEDQRTEIRTLEQSLEITLNDTKHGMVSEVMLERLRMVHTAVNRHRTESTMLVAIVDDFYAVFIQGNAPSLSNPKI